jgi:hypothetical protein
MESETGKPAIQIEAHNKHETRSTNFALYEEFSHKNIAETIKAHRTSFERANVEQRRSLEAEADDEIQAFRIWLEETKNLQPLHAHYYSISLKSLLIGLPTGASLARLFDTILYTLPKPDGT